jgi:hypothetical protein
MQVQRVPLVLMFQDFIRVRKKPIATSMVVGEVDLPFKILAQKLNMTMLEEKILFPQL